MLTTNPPLRIAKALSVVLVLTGLMFATSGTSPHARLTLMTLAATVMAWTVLKLPETPVAIAAMIVLVAAGVARPEALIGTLGVELIVLLIATGVAGGVLSASGTAQRIFLSLLSGTMSVRGLFLRLTLSISATAFLIPSTSARAALALPVFAVLASQISDRRVVRALALHIPTIVLLSACASITGAGAHLIASNHLRSLGLEGFDFIGWAVLGVPFAAATCLLAQELILTFFIGGRDAGTRVELRAPTGALTRPQRNVALVLSLMVVAWATESVHGVSPAVVGLIGALVLTLERLSGVTLPRAFAAIDWNMLLFLAATSALGSAVVVSGAAAVVVEGTLGLVPSSWLHTHVTAIVVLCTVAMLSHLVIGSRSARAAVLLPTIAVPLGHATGQPGLLVFLAVVASGFCQTLRASAKPIALFARVDGVETYSERELLRLSVLLMPGFLALSIVFALWLWPLLGLAGP